MARFLISMANWWFCGKLPNFKIHQYPRFHAFLHYAEVLSIAQCILITGLSNLMLAKVNFPAIYTVFQLSHSQSCLLYYHYNVYTCAFRLHKHSQSPCSYISPSQTFTNNVLIYFTFTNIHKLKPMLIYFAFTNTHNAHATSHIK